MSWLLWVPGPVNSPIVTTTIIEQVNGPWKFCLFFYACPNEVVKTQAEW
jgi:hypothetical protein